MLLGYDIEEVLHEAGPLQVVRARDKATSERVIIKAVRRNVATEYQVSKLAHEHAVLSYLAQRGVTNVPQGVTLVDKQGVRALLMKDIGGHSLRVQQRAGHLGAEVVLQIACDVAQTLANIHSAKVIHKDINPGNIVYNAATRTTQIVDFDIAVRSVHQDLRADQGSVVDGTLAYLAPEQTGRMDRLLDHRADLYSLGVTLYELFGAKRPFAHADDGDLIAAILSEAVPPLDNVPPALAAIVTKLLQKQPEDRYQSGSGLHHDLMRLVEQSAAQRVEASFALGQKDFPVHLEVRAFNYGRQRERERLFGEYERGIDGRVRALLLHGLPGAGKSSLAHDLRLEITARGTITAGGAYDEYNRAVPLSAFSQVISQIVHHLLLKGPHEVAQWRVRLQRSLGNIGAALLDIAPALERLVGKQPSVRSLGPAESENRLFAVLTRFFTALCEDAPVTLFLEDLQWADATSIKLVKSLLDAGRIGKGLTIVGTYRSGEAAAQPLQSLVEQVPVECNIELGSLAKADIESLIADATRVAGPEADELAEVVLAKTGGNPFFVRQFLQFLHDTDLLTYSLARACWQWDVERIKNAPVTDNVAGLVEARLRTLNPETLAPLAAAACLGAEFSDAGVAAATGRSVSDVLPALHDACAGEILVMARRDAGSSAVYGFAHERIRQAARALLDDGGRAAVHHRIGHQMLADAGPQAHGLALVDAVGHLNLGRSCLADDATRRELARLDLAAGQEAKRLNALSVAAQFLRQGIDLLGAQGWQRDYDLMRDLHLNLADAFFADGACDASDEVTDACLAHCTAVLDRAEAFHLRAKVCTTRGDNLGALKLGSTAMRLLGEAGFALHPRRISVVIALLRARLALRHWDKSALTARSAPAGRRALLIADIYDSIAIATYRLGGLYLQLHALDCARILAAQGASPYSAWGLAVMTAPMARLNNARAALRYSELALACNETLPDQVNKAGSLSTAWAFSLYCLRDAETALDGLAETAERAVEEGNPTWLVRTWAVKIAILACLSVRRCETELEERSVATAPPDVLERATITRQFLRALAGATATPTSLSDSAFSAEDFAARSSGTGRAGLYLYNLMLLCMSGEKPVAASYAVACLQDHVMELSSEVTSTIFAFYAALALLHDGAGRAAPWSKAGRALRLVRAKLRSVASVPNGSLGGMLLLVDAVHASLRRQHDRAAKLFEQAVDSLTASGYTCLAAAAAENAGRYHAQRGATTAAERYLRQAMLLYRQWGASSKARSLAQELPRYLSHTENAGVEKSQETTSNTETGRIARLDLRSVMQASRAIAGEVAGDRLVDTIVACLKRSAGATRVILVDGALHLIGDTDDARRPVPETIISFVARSHEVLLLANPQHEGDFRADPYIVSCAPKSILCVPLLEGRKLRGVAYLENAEVSHAFSASHLLLVELLSTQAATSLENARLHAQLDQIVAERTVELRRAHEQLVRAEKQNTEVAMAGGFAHEMRNALTSARYVLDAVASLAEDSKDEAALWRDLQDAGVSIRDVIMTAQQGVERALRVTGRVLEYAEVSRAPVVVAHTPLDEVIDGLVEKMRGEEIDVRRDIVSGLQLPMAATHAQAVLETLLTNARDAVQGGGGAPNKKIVLRAREEDNAIVLRVTDSGAGIASELRPRVFQPFFSTKGGSGTGLSLSIACRLIQAYGGSIDLVEPDGPGCSFEVRWPKMRPEGG